MLLDLHLDVGASIERTAQGGCEALSIQPVRGRDHPKAATIALAVQRGDKQMGEQIWNDCIAAVGPATTEPQCT